ncbi:hypothetical protein CC1G_02888 [Coprinopsis cinerea okayama7|uniref:CHAT domain-containing protein n=1 Tax=Coprinopsis cinerea (strain Okayama-7 / 130 / ATCC MYA-4618 / FGSC 9003) TaxID=240176 RepID=A8MZZ2_COPC7|nr:hypothetical protein CC1G_02888 [Coprinopsis cinerea okayama7\|eukprot:XP_001828307.2 hypothetical protein CC1G_02888 [Coprinopsis cinerea okayama7\
MFITVNTDKLKTMLGMSKEPGKQYRDTHVLLTLGKSLVWEYLIKGNIHYLDDAVALFQEARRLLPPRSPFIYTTITLLCHVAWIRYTESGQMKGREEMDAYRQEEEEEDKEGLAAFRMGTELKDGDEAEVEEAISQLLLSLVYRPVGHLERSASLANLALALYTRFQHSGDLQDLEESILTDREALSLRPSYHPDRCSTLNNLAISLLNRFEFTGQLDDLEQCISIHREVLSIRPPSHPSRSFTLNNLATALRTCFTEQGQVEDLNEAISLLHEVATAESHSHPTYYPVLNNLAGFLRLRFETSGGRDDLVECISLLQNALGVLPDSHPRRISLVVNLAASLSTHFEHKGEVGDLDRSIVLLQESLSPMTQQMHPGNWRALNNLAAALSTRYKHSGQLEDLEESIRLHRHALDLIPSPALHPESLNNLATTLFTHFEHKGSQESLQEAILLEREALDLRSPSDPQRSLSVINLAAPLFARFELAGCFQDLEDAISLEREALELRAEPHPDRSSSLQLGNVPLGSGLADSFLSCFERKGDYRDLEECISFNRKALELSNVPHDAAISLHSNLALALSIRCKDKGSIKDIEEAVLLQRQILELRPEAHPRHSSTVCDLAKSLCDRYEYKGDLNDLHECIALLRQSLALRPEPHPDRHSSLTHLALALLKRYDWLKEDIADLEESISLYQQSLSVLPPSHPNRFAALGHFAVARWKWFLISGDQEDLDAALKLFRAPSEDSLVAEHKGLECPSPQALCQQRDAIIDEIRQLQGFKDFLSPPSTAFLKKAAHNGPVIFLITSMYGCDALVLNEDGCLEHTPLLIQYDALIHLKKVVQQLAQGHYASLDMITDVASSRGEGTRLKAHLKPPGTDSESIPSVDDAFQSVLATLWTEIVKPIIQTLALAKTDSPKRIWWCPTGPFVFLPVHAAGIYAGEDGGSDCLSDYAISSYCSSPQELISSCSEPSEDFKLLVVIEPESTEPGARPLPWTKEELERIRSQVPNAESLIPRVGSKASPVPTSDLFEDIKKSTIVRE